MMNYLSGYWNYLASSTLCELVELFGDRISWPRSESVSNHCWRNRVFNQWRTFWVFLGQVLSISQNCCEALRKAQAWLWYKEKKISSNTAAFCKARIRLEQCCLDKINQEVIDQQQSQVPSHRLWYGRHVKVVDGSSVSMPDTEENQALYPQPSGQKKGCGFPVMRIVAVFSLVTGLMLDCRKGSLHVHERILWHDAWACLDEGDIALGDRGFCSFADYWMLREKKVDCVMRLHQMRKENKIIKRFSKNDYLVQWKKGNKSSKPDWVRPEQWEQMPQEMTVRHVRVSVRIPGFRTKEIIIATTLLDEKKYPAHALAELYRRRWMAELFLRDIKTTMRMDILRCKTPDMVHKELAIFIIAYNLIRSLIWKAALKKGIDPYRISFKGAIVTIRQWAPLMAVMEEKEKKRQFMEMLLQIIASNTIPLRKKQRREPRAIKRRPNANYQLLTKPRTEFREILHRSKYSKERGKHGTLS